MLPHRALKRYCAGLLTRRRWQFSASADSIRAKHETEDHPMALTREQICQHTSQKLSAAAGGLPAMRGLIGLDGFVDSIIAVVDKRHEDGSYDTIPTIAAFG